MIPYLLAVAGGYLLGDSMKDSEKYANGGMMAKGGSLNTYKLRAETLNDFLSFLQEGMYMRMKSFTIEPIGVPDVVVSFVTDASLSEIKSKLKKVPDSHVMLETIKPINEYTGERMAEGGKMADGGMMAKGGKLEVGVYRVGKPTKVSPNLYEQKIVEIFENGDISTASDYGRSLSDFKVQKYPIISKERLEKEYKKK